MPPTDDGIQAVVLPSGQYIAADKIRSWNYNPKIGALRFAFVTRKHTALGYDKLTERVTGVQEQEGRCAATAHRYFRFGDTIYVQDADVRLLHL